MGDPNSDGTGGNPGGVHPPPVEQNPFLQDQTQCKSPNPAKARRTQVAQATFRDYGAYAGNHWKRTFAFGFRDLCETYLSAQGVFTFFESSLWDVGRSEWWQSMRCRCMVVLHIKVSRNQPIAGCSHLNRGPTSDRRATMGS